MQITLNVTFEQSNILYTVNKPIYPIYRLSFITKDQLFKIVMTKQNFEDGIFVCKSYVILKCTTLTDLM